MSDEKRKILEMLSRGKITAEEAEKLLDAVEPESLSQESIDEEFPRYLYVRVDPKEGSKSRDQVKVTVPLALLRAGLNFASLLPQEAREEVEKAMENKGFDFDFKDIKKGDIDSLLTALQELEVNVETAENTVRIYTG